MIKCRKQLRGVTALLGLEYRGKAAFLACFQPQTVLYFEQRFSGNLLLESSDSAWVPPESFYKVLRQSAGIGALCSGDGSTGELSQSPLAIYFWSLRILHGYHRRASVKPSGCLLLESSDSTWVSPEALFFATKNTPGLFMESPGVFAFT